MEDATVTLVAPTEEEGKEEGLCTGRCATACLFFVFVYAATTYFYSFLSVRVPPALLPLASTLPHFVALGIFRNVFGKRANSMQAFYVFLSTLSLALPLLFCLPLLRHGWVLVVGLLDLAANAANVFSLVKPGFLLWALLDSFVLRACPQEALKFGVCFQLREKQKVYLLKNLIFYAAVTAITFSLGCTYDYPYLDSNMQYGSVSGGPQEPHRLAAFGGFAVFHGAFELPSQIITAFLIACNLATSGKETGNSFIQALRGPILLHGIPAFCTQLARHLSQNIAAKFLWGREVEAIPQEALRAVAAATALCQFISTIVMIGSLLIGLFACRRAYLHAKSTQDYASSAAERSPRYLFSMEDIFQKDSDDQDFNTSLLGKYPSDQA